MVIIGICGTLNQFLFEIAGQRIEAKLKSKLYNSMIDQEMAFFDTQKTGKKENK